MTDYFAENLWQLWAIVSVVCLIIELSSGDFFVICFSIGAAAAAIAAALDANIYWQLTALIVCSLASIFFIRPVALRYFHKNEPDRPCNADALIGRIGRVVESIEADGYGRVAIDGDVWKARHDGSETIAEGANVRITRLDSTIVTVEPTTV